MSILREEKYQAMQAEIERLRAAQDRALDVIAAWANQEGISFAATQRLSKMLDVNEQSSVTEGK